MNATPDRKFDTFDEFAQNYREIHTENIKISGADSDYFSEFRALEVRRRLRKMGIYTNNPLRVLDLGCGDGNASRFMVQHIPNIAVDGIDITEAVVESARVRQLPQCTFSVYDGEHIPFGDNTFDVIFCANIFHHIDRAYHVGLYKEIFRVLRKGGVLFNFEHNPWNPITQKVVKDCVFDVDAVLLPSPYHKWVAHVGGFEQVAVRYVIFFPRFALFKPFLGIEPYFSWCPIGAQYCIEGRK
jgi:SAM-dependent methyltransferase